MRGILPRMHDPRESTTRGCFGAMAAAYDDLIRRSGMSAPRLLLLAAPLALAAPDAHACKYPFNFEYDLEPTATDETPPAAIPDVDVGPLLRDAEVGCSDCGGGTSLELTITPPSDDHTAPDDIGYVVDLVEGEFPFAIADHPVEGPTLYFRIAGTSRRPVSAVLGIRPVDRAGNIGPATEVVIDDRPSGCRFAPLSGFAPTWLVILGLRLGARRRRHGSA
jgi:hypothetical protein